MSIKKWLVLAFLLTSAALGSARAADAPRQFGIGLVFFEPSGLTGKAWLGRGSALNAAVGWSAEKNHYLHLQFDYLFLDRRLVGDSNLDLDFYLGVGGKLIFRDTDMAWFRVPLGLDFRLRRAPLNFFFELAPAFDFSTVRLFGAFGFRYLFSS